MSQWAENIYGTDPISVSKDKFGNEIAKDRPMHTNSTPEEGSWNFSGNHYDDSPGMGGYGSYGTEVSAPTGMDKVSVDNSRADRGKEA